MSDTGKLTVKPVPCASCPYRCGVPSGIWTRQEYEWLREYDGEITDQARNGVSGVFMCHQADVSLCSGWAGHRDEPRDLLALRLHAAELDESVFRYVSPVPLFRSGAEAADHGERDIEHPSEEACSMIYKIVRVRQVRGKPVGWG